MWAERGLQGAGRGSGAGADLGPERTEGGTLQADGVQRSPGLRGRAETPPVFKTKRRSGRRVRRAGLRLVPPARSLQHHWVTMEGSPGIGGRSGSPKIPPAMEELQSRLQETLDLLSSQELRSFRDHLKKVEPRVSQVKLELEGRSPSGLARLLAKQYYPPAAAKRVLVQVLEQLPRADLLPRWQSAAADGPGERAEIPRVGGTGGGAW